jgi:hypothetical protein
MSSIQDIDLEFEENKNIKIESIGSISEIIRPWPIQYKSIQAEQERSSYMEE